jgi:hypothetical protein
MEELRLDVTNVAVLALIQQVKEIVECAPTYFMFNMDEIGHGNQADRTENSCLAPADDVEKRLCITVSCHSEWFSSSASPNPIGSVSFIGSDARGSHGQLSGRPSQPGHVACLCH